MFLVKALFFSYFEWIFIASPLPFVKFFINEFCKLA